MDFVIGGLAGAGATIFTNPMDVVKTRFQLQGELRARNENTPRYKSILNALYVIAKNDGVLALQKGLATAMLFGFTMNSVRLGIYHIANVQGWTRSKNGDISIKKTIFCSSMSGIMSGVASNPASVLKTRIQAAAHPSIAVGRQFRYNVGHGVYLYSLPTLLMISIYQNIPKAGHLDFGMVDGFVTIYKNEGIRGLYAGVNAACLRLSISSAAQLTTFSTAKEMLYSYGICQHSPLGLAFFASALSGVMVAIAICPFDITAVRLYNQGPASSGKLLYTGVFDCLRKIYTTEGFHGLYKGLGPLYLRIAPHTTLSLVIWDTLNNLFDNNNKRRR